MSWQILDGKLWQGSVLDSAQRFDVIIDLTIVPDLPREYKLHIEYPIQDHATLPDMLTMTAIAELAAHKIALGYTVLAHCFQGVNRSGLMNGLILHAFGFGDGPAIVAQIQARRPGALTNDTFRNYLLGLKR